MSVASGEGKAQLVCTACAFVMQSVEERAAHYLDEWHRYNVKRRCAGLDPITRALFDSRLEAARKQDEDDTRSFACEACNKTFAHEGPFKAHMASNKHLKRVEALEEQERRRLAAPPEPKAAKKAPAAAGAAPATAEAADGDDDGGDEDEAEEDEAEGDGEERGIPVGHCLMTSAPFDSVEECLDHMLKRYGFYIPYVDYVEDLEGLLGYLGDKVGSGHFCMYCGRRFRTLEGVRRHMVDKMHVKMRFSTAEDEEEYADFYRFESSDEEEDAEGDEAATEQDESAAGAGVPQPQQQQQLIRASDAVQAGPSHLTDKDELALTDGRVLGHRAHMHDYRKAPHPQRKQEMVAHGGGLANKLSLQYRKIGLPGYNQGREKGPVPRDVQRDQNKYWAKVGVKSNEYLRKHIRSQIDF